MKCEECWLLSPTTLADLGYCLVPPRALCLGMEGWWSSSPEHWLLPPWTQRLLQASSEDSFPPLSSSQHLPSLALHCCGAWGGVGHGWKCVFSEEEGWHICFCTGLRGRDVLPFWLVCFQYKLQIAYFNQKQHWIIMCFGLCYCFDV